MTTPESRRERETASAEVEEALARAESLVKRGERIGERWRKSRSDNNFRLMLRNMGKAVNGAS
jgi:hypothetical protein